jgi:hypothetical protein
MKVPRSQSSGNTNTPGAYLYQDTWIILYTISILATKSLHHSRTNGFLGVRGNSYWGRSHRFVLAKESCRIPSETKPWKVLSPRGTKFDPRDKEDQPISEHIYSKLRTFRQTIHRQICSNTSISYDTNGGRVSESWFAHTTGILRNDKALGIDQGLPCLYLLFHTGSKRVCEAMLES